MKIFVTVIPLNWDWCPRQVFFNLPVKGQKNVWKKLNDIKKYIFGFNLRWASKCYFVIGVEEIFILSKKYQQRKKSNYYPWDTIL